MFADVRTQQVAKKRVSRSANDKDSWSRFVFVQNVYKCQLVHDGTGGPSGLDVHRDVLVGEGASVQVQESLLS